MTDDVHGPSHALRSAARPRKRVRQSRTVRGAPATSARIRAASAGSVAGAAGPAPATEPGSNTNARSFA